MNAVSFTREFDACVGHAPGFNNINPQLTAQTASTLKKLIDSPDHESSGMWPGAKLSKMDWRALQGSAKYILDDRKKRNDSY